MPTAHAALQPALQPALPPAPGACHHRLSLPTLPACPCSLEGKAAFLRQVARSLRPGGAFIVVDVFLREGEERGQWVQRFRAYMQEAVDAGGHCVALVVSGVVGLQGVGGWA